MAGASAGTVAVDGLVQQPIDRVGLELLLRRLDGEQEMLRQLRGNPCPRELEQVVERLEARAGAEQQAELQEAAHGEGATAWEGHRTLVERAHDVADHCAIVVSMEGMRDERGEHRQAHTVRPGSHARWSDHEEEERRQQRGRLSPWDGGICARGGGCMQGSRPHYICKKAYALCSRGSARRSACTAPPSACK